MSEELGAPCDRLGPDEHGWKRHTGGVGPFKASIAPGLPTMVTLTAYESTRMHKVPRHCTHTRAYKLISQQTTTNKKPTTTAARAWPQQQASTQRASQPITHETKKYTTKLDTKQWIIINDNPLVQEQKHSGVAAAATKNAAYSNTRSKPHELKLVIPIFPQQIIQWFINVGTGNDQHWLVKTIPFTNKLTDRPHTSGRAELKPKMAAVQPWTPILRFRIHYFGPVSPKCADSVCIIVSVQFFGKYSWIL